MKLDMRSMKCALIAALTVIVIGSSGLAHAEDLKQVSSSPMTGITFDDAPFQLPLDRNFQMAMLTVSTELERTCGKMEAFGWKVEKTEQRRVDRIFKNSINKLRSLGYTVSPETLKEDTRDITIFTADRFTADTSNKHFIFLWSAGNRGLVLNICETDGPLARTGRNPIGPTVETFQLPMQGATSMQASPMWKGKKKAGSAAFTPLGRWVGGYTCNQGLTGGTLNIKQLKGQDFKGTFEFFPTDKNPYVPSGSYEVFGQYDKESKRILVNPGKWIKQPRGYFNTVIVGRFDPDADTFSGFFQGIRGCTSFEAHHEGPRVNAVKKTAKKKKAVKKAPKKEENLLTVDQVPLAAPTSDVTSSPITMPEPMTGDGKNSGVVDPGPSAIVPAPAAPAVAAPIPPQEEPVPAQAQPQAQPVVSNAIPIPEKEPVQAHEVPADTPAALDTPVVPPPPPAVQ